MTDKVDYWEYLDENYVDPDEYDIDICYDECCDSNGQCDPDCLDECIEEYGEDEEGEEDD